jgi:hypothetical protein
VYILLQKNDTIKVGCITAISIEKGLSRMRRRKTEEANTSQNVKSVVNICFAESAINGITAKHTKN